MPRSTFYFDLGSPFAYLACERLEQVLPEPVKWQLVSLGGLFKLNGRSSWALGSAQQRNSGMAEVERRAHVPPAIPGAGTIITIIRRWKRLRHGRTRSKRGAPAPPT